MRRIRFADINPSKNHDGIKVYGVIFLTADPTPVWAVSTARTLEKEFDTQYEGDDFKLAQKVWRKETGTDVLETMVCSGEGYGRREDWPRWFCWDACEAALRNPGQWRHWNTSEWVKNIWSPKLKTLQSWTATEMCGVEHVVNVCSEENGYHRILLDGVTTKRTNKIAPNEYDAFDEVVRLGGRVIEWRRSDEPSRADMRAAMAEMRLRNERQQK